jgi:ADP-heptose:LPS heptosyltransferase
MNLPALRLLRQAFPKGWITLMAEKSVADILQSHSDLDEVLPVDSKRLETDGRYRKRLFADIRQARFDAGIAANASKLIGCCFQAAFAYE